MSGYYAHVSNISGSKSTVATSAYMSREELKDETMNHTFNYSRHEQDNTFSNVCLCANAPEEWQDKEKLWNAVEQNEQGKNTRKAKEWILAIPQELTQEQREQAVKEFQEYLAEKGMCTQADIHEPDSKRSASKVEKNYHVHVLGTQRLIAENGEWEQIKEKKVYANCLDESGKPAYNPDLPTDAEHRIPKIDPETGQQKIGARNRKEWERVKVQSNPLDSKELIEESRAKWAEVCNKHLAAEQQIDHRSYDRQGIDKVAQIHEGIGYHHQDERAEYNKAVIEVNESMELMKSQAPEELSEVRSELNAIRDSLEHDRDSIRATETFGRTAGDNQTFESYPRPEELEIAGVRARAERLERPEQEILHSGNETETSGERPESRTAGQPENSRNAERDRLLEERSRERETAKQKFSEGFIDSTIDIAGVREGQQRNLRDLQELKAEQQRTRAEQQEVKGEQQRTSFKAEHIGRGTIYDLDKSESIGAEQRNLEKQTFSIRNKLTEIRDRLVTIRDSIKERFTRTAKPEPEQTRQQADSTRPTSQNTQSVKENSTMAGMSRLAQIQAQQQIEKEREQEREKARENTKTEQNAPEQPQSDQRESVRDKLNRFTQESKEGRSEPLQSEQQSQEQTQQVHRRRGHRR